MICLRASLMCLFGLAACGGATAAPSAASSVDGTVGGQSFNAVDQIGQLWTTSTASGSSISSAGVVLSTVAGTCSIAEHRGNPPNVTTLAISVMQDSASVGPGTYVVGRDGVVASYEEIDSACKGAKLNQAAAGALTLTTSNSAWVVGSFNLTFDSGDHLTGNFSAPVCSALLFQTAWQGTCGS